MSINRLQLSTWFCLVWMVAGSPFPTPPPAAVGCRENLSATEADAWGPLLLLL